MSQLDNIPEDFDNLEKYAPILSSIPRKNCYKAPEGYFEVLPEIVAAVTMVNAEAGTIKSQSVPDGYIEYLADVVRGRAIISDISNTNTFTTPINYFEHLPERIMERIHGETASVGWLAKLINVLWNPRIAIAFGTFIVLLASGVYLSKQQSDSMTSSDSILSDISEHDLSASESIALFDEDDLIDEVAGLEVADMMVINAEDVSSVDNSEIEEWIQDEVDVQTLINEL